MRLLMHVKIPHKEFNAALKDGSVGKKIQRILDANKPQAVYFTNYQGQRGAILIVDVADPSRIPGFAEPWFLTFSADVEFHAAMTPEDLGRAGLEELARQWA